MPKDNRPKNLTPTKQEKAIKKLENAVHRNVAKTWEMAELILEGKLELSKQRFQMLRDIMSFTPSDRMHDSKGVVHLHMSIPRPKEEKEAKTVEGEVVNE